MGNTQPVGVAYSDPDLTNVTVSGTLNVTGTTTLGTLVTTGALSDTAAIKTTNATDATSITTGALQSAGGLGVTKAAWIGGLLNVAGASTLTGAVGCGALTSTGAITGTTGVLAAPWATPTFVTTANSTAADGNSDAYQMVYAASNKLVMGIHSTGSNNIDYAYIRAPQAGQPLWIGDSSGYGVLKLIAGAATFSGSVTAVAGTFTGLVTTVASATGSAGLNIPHGAAPTSPVNGDVWTTTSGMFVRINGTTKTVTLT